MFGDPLSEVGNVRLGEVASLRAGKFVSAKDIHECGDYPCYGGNGIRGWVSSYNHEGFYPLIGRQGALCGNVQLAKGRFYATEHAVVVKPIVEWHPVYMHQLLTSLKLGRLATGAAQPGLSVGKLEELLVSVAPLALQREFAALVEKVEALKATAQKELEKVDLLCRAKLQEYFG
jgi:type I restriction enzyme, S subunit